jgi:hypothetical protein
MPRRKPLYRPSEETFIGAALRVVRDEYNPVEVHMPNGWYTNVFNISEDRQKDLAILKAERDADGWPGEYESLADYALTRLVLFKKT